MLHFKTRHTLKRETHARTTMHKFFNFGASVHRLGTSTEFICLIPIKRPERREALLKMLERNSLGEQFDLVDVYSMEGGPQYRLVQLSELDSAGRLIEKRDGEHEYGYDAATA